ncbi:hypothetical protein [Streptomyces sp. NPDC059639]|uniref:hypothetical protein n=1 Tax=Streptomyces sp. NPDC059639 TaxID=3346891 RepID=UPI0036C32AC1
MLAKPMRAYCTRGDSDGPPDAPTPKGGGGFWDGGADSAKDLVEDLLGAIKGLIAPKDAWAPRTPDNAVYSAFMWLGQHLAVGIFTCVVVVCALTAWQGAPRLKQMGASTGWTLTAVAGMASIPGAVMLLNRAVSRAFSEAFDSNEGTLFAAIREDLKSGADVNNPLARVLIFSALVVFMGVAVLVFMTRNLGIFAFTCIAPIVLASLARGGDMGAVKTWAMRLLGLMFAPFALLLIAPLVPMVRGSLAMDAVLLVVADVLMLRMIFHGIPYFGPRLARGARALVERRIDNPLALRALRAGVPDFYEQEDTPRHARTVMTPRRAAREDGSQLLGSYGIRLAPRSGRLTTPSAVAQATREAGDRAARHEPVLAARRAARAQFNNTPTPPPPAAPGAAPATPRPRSRPTPPPPAPPPAP